MKKGFSLIELLVAISILSIITSFSIIEIVNFKRISNNIDVMQSSNSILMFINSSKQYCRKEGISGYILIDIVGNKMIFCSNGTKKNELAFSKSIKLYGVNLNNGKINIDKEGFTSSACTLQIRDSFNKLYDITICVGTGYVEIKKPKRVFNN